MAEYWVTAVRKDPGTNRINELRFSQNVEGEPKLRAAETATLREIAAKILGGNVFYTATRSADNGYRRQALVSL